ncbi:MAG: preprotein translocase subunit SecE [Parcubacteria group bacterium]
MKPLNSFFSEVLTEFKQITWPDRKETIRLVTVVIVFSIGMALFLGLADYVFSQILQRFILKV